MAATMSKAATLQTFFTRSPSSCAVEMSPVSGPRAQEVAWSRRSVMLAQV